MSTISPGHEEVRLVEPGADPRVATAERAVDERQRALVRPDVPPARHAVPQAQDVELEDLLAARAPRREVGLELVGPLEAPDLDVAEEQPEQARELALLEEVDVERVLEVRRAVGRDHERGPRVVEHARELGHVELGRREVLDDVRRARPVHGAPTQPEPGAVHAGETEVAPVPALRAPVGGRSDRGVGVVVDAEHAPVAAGEPGGLVADAATDVEHGAGPEPRRHLAVPRVVEGEERVGRRPGHGPLTRQLHGSSAYEPRERRPRTASGGVLTYHFTPTHGPHRVVAVLARPRPGRGDRQDRRPRGRIRAPSRLHARVARPRRPRGGGIGGARVHGGVRSGVRPASRSPCGRRTRPVTRRSAGATGTA